MHEVAWREETVLILTQPSQWGQALRARSSTKATGSIVSGTPLIPVQSHSLDLV